MVRPEVLDLEYTYRKPENSVQVLNVDDIPIEKDQIRDQQIINIAPKGVGGNHRHSRKEWFVGVGDLVFAWLDEKGEKQEIHMHPNGQMRLITVPSFLPHAVINMSNNQNAVLFEFADGKLQNVESMKVI